MALTDLLDINTEETTFETINGWEDFMDGIMKLDTTSFDTEKHGAGIRLYEFSIRSLLVNMGIPTHLIYPIMRINGYKRETDMIQDTKWIKIPEQALLEQIYDIMTLTVGFNSNIVKI